MKRILLLNHLKSVNAGRLAGLFLCLIFSAGLSGQKVQTNLIETWNNGNWINSARSTNTYDASNYLTKTLSQNWDDMLASWVNFSQSNYTNNSDGTAHLVVVQSWDDNSSTWSDLQRTTYTYNGSGKVLTSISELWTGVSWLNSIKLANNYDGSGYLVNEVTQSWNLISSIWQNVTQTNYTNNINGLPSQDITQLWDIGTSTWTNSQRSTYTYNGSNKILTTLDETWVSGNWQTQSTETNTYNGSGYLTNSLSKNWDIPSTTFINDSQSNYSNNIDGSINQIINQLWDTGTSQWTNSQRITFTYSIQTGSRNFHIEENSVLYPNPVHDVITIKLDQTNINGFAYSLTDQAGRQLLKGKLTEEKTSLDIHLLPNGIYFLRLGTSPQKTFKVIKE